MTMPISTPRGRALRAASANSTPPAPPPTNRILMPGRASSRRVRQWGRNRPMGLTGTPEPPIASGTAPQLTESRSKRTGGRSAHRTLSFSRSSPVTASTIRAGAGRAAERTEIYVNVFPPVVPRHVPRQHAGIRRMRLPGDDGDPHPFHGSHPQRLQHLHMAVPAPDQNQVEDRRAEVRPHRLQCSGTGPKDAGTRSVRGIRAVRRG